MTCTGPDCQDDDAPCEAILIVLQREHVKDTEISRLRKDILNHLDLMTKVATERTKLREAVASQLRWLERVQMTGNYDGADSARRALAAALKSDE